MPNAAHQAQSQIEALLDASRVSLAPGVVCASSRDTSCCCTGMVIALGAYKSYPAAPCDPRVGTMATALNNFTFNGFLRV